MRAPLLLYLLAVAIHAAWALAVPWPVDWDPAYYQSVAHHLAAGDGAVTGAVWSLAWVPDTLPYPAHLHWMPMPAWVLVPGVLLWPAHGAQAVAVLIAATWAPLAWALARELGVRPGVALLAGALAATGLVHARFLSTPDSIALYGAVGGAAFLAASRDRWGWCAALAVVAALTRNDGFLLAWALGFGVSRGWVVALAGTAATAGWTVRNALVAPESLALRRAVANAADPAALVAGDVGALGLVDRVTAALAVTLEQLPVVLLVYLPLPAAIAWLFRRERWVGPLGVHAVLLLVVAPLLAPGVVASGSQFRSSAALVPLACALAAWGIAVAAEWLRERRDLHPAFTTALLAGSVALGSLVAFPILGWRGVPGPPPCPDVDGPLFSAQPLQIEARCGIPGVVITPDVPPERALAVADDLGVRWLLVTREIEGLTLPGWVEVAPGLLAAPAPRSEEEP